MWNNSIAGEGDQSNCCISPDPTLHNSGVSDLAVRLAGLRNRAALAGKTLPAVGVF